MPLFSRTAVVSLPPLDHPASGEHARSHPESLVGARFRVSHGDPARWSAEDLGAYLDLAHAMGGNDK